jgi:2-dehydropantoate 2-reductase
MHVVVIGAGSVGLLLAARLRLSGQSVELVTRSEEQASRLCREGLVLHKLTGEKEKVAIRASAMGPDLPTGDLYLLAVKQTDLAALLPRLRPLRREARILALQNGMGHHELLAASLEPEQCYFAINTEGARRSSPVEVIHTGSGLIRIGPWDRRAKRDPVIDGFLEAASRSGIPAQYEEEIAPFAWRKLLANSVINPLTALFEIPNGMLLELPATVKLMRNLFEEAAAVANSSGQKIVEADWQEIGTICRNTSPNYSSMLQDIWKGKPTEVEAINGFLVRQGKKAGIPTPLHETVRRAIHLKTSLSCLKGEARDGCSG